MKIDPVKKAPMPAISGEDLVALVPEVSKYAKIEVNNVSNVPSDYMDPPRWIALSCAGPARGGRCHHISWNRYARGDGLLARRYDQL
jgi:hypothetical protein